jgi:GNAT superfamily N-acetyltransferase
MPIDIAMLSGDDLPAADEIATLVNKVYAGGEAGLWLDGEQRTTPDEVTALIRAGEMAAARMDGKLVGVVRVQQLSATTGEFGMLAADPELRGVGIGRDLVAYAEAWMRDRGLAVSQLELLVPQTWAHPVKEFLRAWYQRLGYRVVRTDAFEADYSHLVPYLATPCDFLVFHKSL